MSTPDELAAQPPPGATPSAAPDRQALIPGWLRVAVVLTVLPIWSIAVLYSLFMLKKLPDVAWMAVPSAIIVAVAPAWSWPGRNRQQGGDA